MNIMVVHGVERQISIHIEDYKHEMLKFPYREKQTHKRNVKDIISQAEPLKQLSFTNRIYNHDYSWLLCCEGLSFVNKTPNGTW